MSQLFRAKYPIGSTVWYVNERTEVVQSVVEEISFRGHRPKNIKYRLDSEEVWSEQFLFPSRMSILDKLLATSESK